MASLQTTSYVTRPRDRSGHITNRKLILEASVTFNIRVRNLDRLSRLATELSQIPLVRVNEISWILTDSTLAALQIKLRKMATADVLQKAKDNAAALDLHDVTLSELFEQQDSTHPVNAAVAPYNGGGTDIRSTVLPTGQDGL